MDTKRFSANTLYQLSSCDAQMYCEEALDDYGDNKEYFFARSVDYAAGSKVADCWICDFDGNIHPGYSNSPVPLCIDDLLVLSNSPDC